MLQDPEIKAERERKHAKMRRLRQVTGACMRLQAACRTALLSRKYRFKLRWDPAIAVRRFSRRLSLLMPTAAAPDTAGEEHGGKQGGSRKRVSIAE